MFKGSIPALITPFKNDYKIDYDALDFLLEMHINQASDAIALAGTTGESPTLESSEVEELIIFCKKKLGSSLPLIVGTGSNCTKKSVAMTQRAKELGADAALVIVPYYNKPTDEGCLAHFKLIANVGLPTIAYHHPGRTGKTLSIASLVELVNMPNVVGLKEASGALDTTKRILRLAPKANIFSGDDPLTLDLIKLGASGSISIIANLYPKKWSTIVNSALKSDFAFAKKEYESLEPIINEVLLMPNPIGIKQAMHAKNLCNNCVRLPLVASTPILA